MPKTIDDIKGQKVPVQIIKTFLETNNHPYSLFVSGPSGSGKGVLVSNYIRALHCENRKPGEYTACGKCAQCKLDPKTKDVYNDVVWVQAGKNDETINSQFKEALKQADLPPRVASPLEDHRYYKVIVFDELQGIPVNIIQNLLFKSETTDIVERNHIIFIMITMSELSIEQKDPALAQALRDRSFYIRMNEPSREELNSFLLEKFEIKDAEIRDVLVDAAQGSYRGVIRCYEQVKPYIHLGADVCSDIVYVASPSRRKKLWAALMSKTQNPWPKIKDMMDKIDKTKASSLKKVWEDTHMKNIDGTTLVKQLLSDMDKSEEMGHPVDPSLQKLLIDYLLSGRHITVWHLLKQLKGKELITLDIFNEYEAQDGFEKRFGIK